MSQSISLSEPDYDYSSVEELVLLFELVLLVFLLIIQLSENLYIRFQSSELILDKLIGRRI